MANELFKQAKLLESGEISRKLASEPSGFLRAGFGIIDNLIYVISEFFRIMAQKVHQYLVILTIAKIINVV